ncbi:MAG: OmpH family outer membrane protein [Treponema sp.]|nr:OmpH family outer membrane protein [Treponema sp.]
MNKIIIFICLLVGGIFSLEAQQLTRFAVVDLPRVYTSFFRDSRAVRDFEARSARVQVEIDKMNEEILTLKSQLVDAQAQNDNTRALRLENDIYKKSEFLQQYYQTKTEELETQRKRLANSNTFYQQVYDEIRIIAESEGYSMVLSLKDNKGILWYSPTVDITDTVIQNLQSKAGSR